MQTSAELVRNAIRLKPVDRLPLYFPLLNEVDMLQFFMKNPSNWKPKKEKIPFDMYSDYATGIGRKTDIRKEDEWGCIWGVPKGTYGIGEPIESESPLKELDKLDNYKFPDPYGPGRFDGLDEFIDNNKDKYIEFDHIIGIFERLHFLHGFSQTMIDMATNSEKIEKLLDKIVEFHIIIINRLGKKFGKRVHQYAITDDWGTQTSLFIKPDLWRRIYKPRYRKLAEEAHKYSLDFGIHSDGNLTDIIDDFIEIGVDVLDLPQPSSIYGIKEFGLRFGGKVGLHVYSDIQTTSVSGTMKRIRKEAEEIVEYWSTDDVSGIVAMDYPDIESIGGDIERKKVALEAFKNAFDKKKKRYINISKI